MPEMQSVKRTFGKELLSIALPVALQNLMLALVGASDALMLGRLSQNAVSAVSLANQISFVMSLFSAAVIGGAAALIGQYYGKGDRETVKNIMSVSIRISFLISVVFFAAALLVPEFLMGLYTSDAELIAIGSKYLRIVSWSYLFTGISQNYLLVMKISGRASRSAIISTMTVLIDMFADVFLIYGIAGVPRLEEAGCAVSTVAVEACALIFCIAESYTENHIHPDIKSMFYHSKELGKDMLKISLPVLASSLTWGIGYTLNSAVMGRMGADAVAAMSITMVVVELTSCFCKGLSNGAQIMIGGLLGQNKFEEARIYGVRFCRIAFGCGILNAAMLLVVGPAAGCFFILTAQARTYLIQMMIFLALYLFAYSFNTIITCGVFPAGGDTIYDAMSVIISKWCFAVPLALLGLLVFKWPVMAVFICIMSDEIVKVPWIYPRYRKYIWVKNLTREQRSEETKEQKI